MPDLIIEEADRPATKEADDAYFLKAYRKALDRIDRAVGLPGSPDLLTAIPAAVERLVAKVKRQSEELEAIGRHVGNGLKWEGDASTWTLKSGALRLTVTRRVRLEGWHVGVVPTLWRDFRPLQSEELDDARHEAVRYLLELTSRQHADAEAMLRVTP